MDSGPAVFNRWLRPMPTPVGAQDLADKTKGGAMSDETLYTTGSSVDAIGETPVLVHALTGGMDAGNAGAIAVRQLLGTMPAQRVATFDTDTLLDLRSRRPAMTFSDGRWVDYDEPVLAVEAVRDHSGRSMLVLHGHEPDTRWEAFARAVGEIARDFGVELVVGMQGVPAAVPHTRPSVISTHGTDRDAGGRLMPGPNIFSGNFQAPGSAEALLDLRLAEQDMPVLGLAVHVPHYLAASEYPMASAALLRNLSTATGLSLPVGDLESMTARVLASIDEQVAESEEVQAVVKSLEERYDRSPIAIAAGLSDGVSDEVPTADEIGAELEAFLASAPPLDVGLGDAPEDSSGTPGDASDDDPDLPRE
jgi:predicted ATP-grasp superfamily ATP-dependent carboligase